jgi:L-lactate dehydrogenase complex protein LldF
MGSVLTPQFIGVEQAAQLPNASTFCGRCESVCPVRIPLPKLMRHWREREFEKHLTPSAARFGLKIWASLARRPALYRVVAGLAARSLRLIGGKSGRIRHLPLASGWTAWRDMPAPQGKTFQQQWHRQRRVSS